MMEEAIEILQCEVYKIKTHIRAMRPMSDVVQCDLVGDWPERALKLEVAIKRLQLVELAATDSQQRKGEICHDGLHFKLGVIPETENYRCYACGWEGKLSPVA